MEPEGVKMVNGGIAAPLELRRHLRGAAVRPARSNRTLVKVTLPESTEERIHLAAVAPHTMLFMPRMR